MEQRAHVRVFVGNEIGQQEDGGRQGIEGTANQADLILQAIGSCVRFLNGDTKGMSWKGVSSNSMCRLGQTHLETTECSSPKTVSTLHLCAMLCEFGREKLFWGMDSGTHSFSLIFNCRNQREGLPLKICCAQQMNQLSVKKLLEDKWCCDPWSPDSKA